MKNQIREIKLREKNDYIDNPTDKRIVLFERENEFNKIGNFFTWDKNSIEIKGRKVLNSKEKSRKQKFKFPGKILIN